MKIGILFIATGRYIEFFDKVRESFEKYFLPNHEKVYFLFTDTNKEYNDKNIIKIYKEYKGFPEDTLFRYHIFHKQSKLYKKHKIDYLFYSDVDMLAVNNFRSQDIILKKNKTLIACHHPGYYKMKINGNNNNAKSLTYLGEKKGITGYYCGGFQGGLTNDYLNAMKDMIKIIDDDERRGTRAKWHDESNWNFYIYNNLKKFQFISPEYCYPESKYKNKNMNNYNEIVGLTPRLLALDKDHNYYRTDPNSKKKRKN